MDLGLSLQLGSLLTSIGFGIMVIGAIVSVFGWLWNLKIAFADSSAWGWGLILSNGIPGVGPIVYIIFLATHFRDAWKPFVVSIVGTVIGLAGLFMGALEIVSESQKGGPTGGPPTPVTNVVEWVKLDRPRESHWVEGGTVRFDRMRGQVVVAELWDIDDPETSDPVTAKLDKLLVAHAARGLVVLSFTGVNADMRAEAVAHCEQKVPYPVGFLDPYLPTAIAFDAFEEGLPRAMVIGRGGTVRWSGDPRWESFDEALLAALEEPAPHGTSPVFVPPPPEAEVPVEAYVAPADIDWTNEAVVLQRAASPDSSVREEAVNRWIAALGDKEPGARLRMLQALPKPIDGPVQGSLVKSVLARPPAVREAIDCLPLASTELRTTLIKQLAQPGRSDEEAAAIEAAISGFPEGATLVIEEALVHLGRPRSGAASRLVKTRGMEWARTPEGRAVLERIERGQLVDLAAAPERDVRALCCDLLALGPPDVSWPILDPLLRDPERSVRQAAIAAGGALRDVAGAAPLSRALAAETDEATRTMLRTSIGNLPQQSTVPALVELLRSQAPADRQGAVMALEVVARAECIGPLVGALRDPDRVIAVAAAKALSALQSLRGGVGLAEGIQQRVDAVGAVARETKDAEVRRITRHIYFQVRNRLPDQDAPRAPAPTPTTPKPPTPTPPRR